jgi:hypothetical protein
VTDADDVLRALEQVVTNDLPDELLRVNARKGLSLAAPVVLEQLSDPTVLIDSTRQFPAVSFSSPGLAESPTRKTPWSYDAAWTCLVAVMDRGATGTYRATATAIRVYTAALRTVVMRHQSLGGLAYQVLWADEDYAAFDDDKSRTLGMGTVEFTVYVRNALDASAAPELPFTPTGPLIKTTEVDVTRKD